MVDISPHIGTLREKPLHASLKRWYSEADDRIEMPVDGYVIDLVRDDLLIEIQTRGFSSMKSKVTALLEQGHRIRIVHPIAVDRWIVKVDADGEVLSRRRSPKHGTTLDIFAEMVSFPALMVRPELGLEVVLVIEEEIRRHSDDGPWRRRGWSVLERHLLEVIESVSLGTPEDLAELLPIGLAETFTTTDLVAASGCTRRVAQQMVYCLRKMNMIEPVGKVGNSIEYQVV